MRYCSSLLCLNDLLLFAFYHKELFTASLEILSLKGGLMCGLRCYLYCASNALPKLKFKLGLATDFLLNEAIVNVDTAGRDFVCSFVHPLFQFLSMCYLEEFS